MLWEEYLGWHFHFIRCMHIRFNLVLPTDEKEKQDKPDAPQRDAEQEYKDYVDISTRIAEQEAEQAR